MKKKQKLVYPSKKTVNLIPKSNTRRTVIIYTASIVIFCIALGFFTKYAVIDRLEAAAQAQHEAQQLENQYAILKTSNEDYDEILREYQHYYSDTTANSLASNASSRVVLQLLEDQVLYRSNVISMSFSATMLQLRLTGLNLDALSKLMVSLEAMDEVANVSVSTANAAGTVNADEELYSEDNTVAFVTVILNPTGGAVNDAP